jgi:hypothetical protein
LLLIAHMPPRRLLSDPRPHEFGSECSSWPHQIPRQTQRRRESQKAARRNPPP